MRELEKWEKTNVVVMPSPIVGHPFAGAPPPAPRVDHAAEQARLAREATAKVAEPPSLTKH
jgi:hypothetical protein